MRKRTIRRSRFSEEPIIEILRGQEAGRPTADVCRKHRISGGTSYKWKSKFGGMGVSDENARLEKLLAATMLDNAIL
jgi:putative transposase